MLATPEPSPFLWVFFVVIPGLTKPVVLEDNVNLWRCPGLVALERRAMLEIETATGKPLGYAFKCLPRHEFYGAKQ